MGKPDDYINSVNRRGAGGERIEQTYTTSAGSAWQ